MRPITIITVLFLLIGSPLYSQNLHQVVDQVNGAMNTTIDSVKLVLKADNKRLNEEKFGEWMLYDRFGIYTFVTDVNNEYVVEVYYVPYQDDWFEKQDYSKYMLSEDESGVEEDEWADDVKMYKDEESGVWFGDITNMEGERRIAIWSSN